jgi:hypothetical protein
VPPGEECPEPPENGGEPPEGGNGGDGGEEIEVMEEMEELLTFRRCLAPNSVMSHLSNSVV